MASATRSNLLRGSSPITRWKYDVFLNFRGDDTRRGFTDHLYAALDRFSVYTFKDDEELRKGDYFPTELLEAVQGSKISIVVISKTYASSSWCLDELVKILECKEMLNQVVLPIFYHVDPSEVRKQTGGFGDAFTQHGDGFGADKIGAWKAALTKIAGFIGWHLKEVGDRFESEYINEVVEVVQQEVNHTYLNVAKHPVGIDARVTEIHSLLQSGANDDVRIIGIHGMGGVGKTTLAKAIFNKIYRMFQGSSFLADVRSKGLEHLDRLQEKLLRETLKTKKFEVDNVHQGISLVKERLGLKKLLVVVDDVNHISQLEALAGEPDWFGPGSIIIITTRDVHLLNCLGIDEKYEVERLSSWESLRVFSLHAFRNPVPLEAYAKLSNMIVSYAGGLPLALTVLGSHFRGRKSIQEWRDDFEKLRRIPHDDILKILKISYDALDDDTQRIFLDIACFFIGGFYKEDIVMILNGSGFYAQSGIRTLIDRCLLAEDLSMHDLVRDMGREVVRKESPTQPEKRSRLIFADDVFDVLRGNKGTEAIEAMIIDFRKKMNVHLSTKVFSKMTRLRLLKIRGLLISGSLKHLSNELRLLSWHNCHLKCIPSDLCMEKLVILNMKESSIEEFQPSLQHFGCLKTLRLDWCRQLKRAPDFTGAHSLQTLSLNGCWNFIELPQSIGDLKNLVQLEIAYCVNLRKLPTSICKLTFLELLNLEVCSKIEELPTDLGKLEQLRELNACLTPVSLLPFSCTSMRNLDILFLGSKTWSLDTENSFAALNSWDFLCDTLPFNHCHLSTLKSLGLTDCQNLQGLQELLPSLEEFNATNCLLPEKVLGHLSTLWKLNLNKCQSPRELQVPPRLEVLHIVDCLLPEKVVGHLSMLKILRLEDCQNLRVLQELPPNLLELYVQNCLLLEKVLGLSDLKHLRFLGLYNCNNLIELHGLENIVSIQQIQIRNCRALTIDPWIINFFKACSRDFGVQMWLSKDMVPEILCSNKVVGSSSNYILEGKLQLIIGVFQDGLYSGDLRCALNYKTTAIELLSYWLQHRTVPRDGWVQFAYNEYAHFEKPIKVEELEVCIEFRPYNGRVEDKIGDKIHPYLVFEGEDGEVCFFPMNPNVEIKYSRGWKPGEPQGEEAIPDSDINETEPIFFDSDMETEDNCSPMQYEDSSIWELFLSFTHGVQSEQGWSGITFNN